MSNVVLPASENSTDQDDINIIRHTERELYPRTAFESFEIDTTSIIKINSNQKPDCDFSDAESLEIKPRFNWEELSKLLLSRFDQVKKQRIEVLEASLYNIGMTYNLDFLGADLPITVLDTMHHIYQLKRIEPELDIEEIQLLNHSIEEVLERYPLALVEYKLYSKICELVSALSIRWGVAVFENYSYRYTSRVSNVKLLDLEVLNSDIYTVECLWLAIALRYSPIDEIIDDNVIQYAQLLRSSMDEVVRIIVHLNNEADFIKVPSLEGYFAAKFPILAERMKWQPNYLVRSAPYHELSQPEGFFANCFKPKFQSINLQLKRRIEDLDICYRSFERALISCVLLAKNSHE